MAEATQKGILITQQRRKFVVAGAPLATRLHDVIDYRERRRMALFRADMPLG